MKRALFILITLLFPASVYAAIGDLTVKPCNPNEIGGWSVHTSGPQDIRPAPADCGTINPKAKVITLRSRAGRTFLAALDSAKADDKILNVLRLDVAGTGKFTPEMSAALEWPNADGSGVTRAGPLTVQLPQGGKTMPAEVRGSVTATTGNELIGVNLTFGTCLEGQCAFGDKIRVMRFIDSDNNGKWDDPAKVRVQDGVPRGRVAGDRMQIAGADGKFECVVVGTNSLAPNPALLTEGCDENSLHPVDLAVDSHERVLALDPSIACVRVFVRKPDAIKKK